MFSFVPLQVVKTHLRNMIIVPEMIGSIVGIYNGKSFNQVEVKVSETSRTVPVLVSCRHFCVLLSQSDVIFT